MADAFPEKPPASSRGELSRLRDYRVKGQGYPLIRESRLLAREPFAFCITDHGKAYYCENWQRYREMYPEVDAPEPAYG